MAKRIFYHCLNTVDILVPIIAASTFILILFSNSGVQSLPKSESIEIFRVPHNKLDSLNISNTDKADSNLTILCFSYNGACNILQYSTNEALVNIVNSSKSSIFNDFNRKITLSIKEVILTS